LIEHQVVYHVHHVVFQQVLIRFLFLDFHKKYLVFPINKNKYSKYKTSFIFFVHTDFGKFDLVFSVTKLLLFDDGTGTVCSC